MKLLSGLSRFLGTRQRMSSASLYRRDGSFFVVTLHGSGGGDPCIAAGPMEVLPVDARPSELGEAIIRGLGRTTHNHPYPATQQEWKQVTEPLLSAASCKSWPSFAKKASSLRVNQMDGKLQVLPCVRDAKGSFYPVAERERHLEVASAEQLGALVAAELEFAASRDDAQPFHREDDQQLACSVD
jgi:hypothetical protein